MNKKIVFFGNEQLAQGLGRPFTPTFDILLAKNYQITAIVLPEDPAKNTISRKKKTPMIIEKANQHHIPLIFANTTPNLAEILANLNAEIGILSSFGKIVTQSIIDIFPNGILNVHPSLLPKYRGTTPIETAILNGDKTVGVSVMKLVAKMDAGVIYAQRKIEIGKDNTKDEIYEKLATAGAEMTNQVLNDFDEIIPTKQDETKATYTQKLNKELSILKPQEKTAKRLHNEVRAYLGFPKSKLSISGVNCTITLTHVATQPQTEIDPKCQDGNYLIIDRLIPEGRKEMTATDFINGRHR
ncbi:MAG: methionyl-tRNA formyltransferase [Candidatus Nomurabacteria bacterium]|jgi:methionyl-tRNA formyltransferase|nr:methionyl-tRNA formyltransferase [Candidatus Nomurabacteria bacterium]